MKVVYFDGYCNLCNGFVDFLIRWDSGRTLRFSSLQSEFSVQKFRGLNLSQLTADPTTVVFESEDQFYFQSSAALRAIAALGGYFKLAMVFWLIPSVLRDFVYQRVARNRYRIFGRRDSCRLPTEDEKKLFL